MYSDLEKYRTLAFANSIREYASEYFVNTFFVPAITLAVFKFRLQIYPSKRIKHVFFIVFFPRHYSIE